MRTPSFLEHVACYSIWAGAIAYSSFQAYRQSRKLHHLLDSSLFSPPSHSLLSSVKDSSDNEWIAFRSLFLFYWSWVVVYVVLSIVTRNFLPPLVFRIFLPAFSLLFLSHLISVKFAVGIGVLAFVLILLSWTRTTTLSYGLFLTSVWILHLELILDLKRKLFVRDESILVFDVSVSWLLAKGLSMSLSKARRKHEVVEEYFLTDLSYLLYFPSLLTGPIHLYDSFTSDLSHSNKRVKVDIFIHSLLNIAKILIYAAILDHLHHFLHTHAFQFHPHLMLTMNGWSFCGIGYTLTALFYLKYVVLYGFSQSLSSFDSISLPAPPQCVSTVCQSIMLWRTFDRGLYSWLLECFYKPIMQARRQESQNSSVQLLKQIVASLVCFSCIAIWHTREPHVVVWCGINFLSVLVERVVNLLFVDHLRVKCIVSAPLFALMVISNIFFLSNMEVGIMFLKRIFTQFPLPLLPTMAVMYAGCFVSFTLQESKSEDDRKRKMRKQVLYTLDDNRNDYQHFMQE